MPIAVLQLRISTQTRAEKQDERDKQSHVLKLYNDKSLTAVRIWNAGYYVRMVLVVVVSGNK